MIFDYLTAAGRSGVSQREGTFMLIGQSVAHVVLLRKSPSAALSRDLGEPATRTR